MSVLTLFVPHSAPSMLHFSSGPAANHTALNILGLRQYILCLLLLIAATTVAHTKPAAVRFEHGWSKRTDSNLLEALQKGRLAVAHAPTPAPGLALSPSRFPNPMRCRATGRRRAVRRARFEAPENPKSGGCSGSRGSSGSSGSSGRSGSSSRRRRSGTDAGTCLKAAA
jgi:uncharacterized membrane protein YgcG